MRIRFALAISAFAVSAFAVTPQFWRVRNAEDFLAGDVDGFAVTSRGELRAGPTVKKVASFTDPFVLTQTTAPNGDRFFGTGNDGKVYRLRGNDLKLLYTANEPEIYAIAFHDGALYVGSSPNGKIYRVDPESGKGTTFFDPKEAYIWSLAFLPDGSLAIATGVDGKLYLVASNGQGKVLFDSPETHLRSLAVKSDGTILAGGSAKARIYEVHSDGTAHALYDSSLNEISAMYVDKNGIGWAAGVSNTLPSSAPQKPASPKSSSSQPSGTSTSSNEQTKTESSGNVEVSFSFDDQNAQAQTGAGELYKINPDGFVEIVRKFDKEMIYAIGSAPDGGILLSTGPRGRVYEVKGSDVSLLASVPDKQVVSISSSGNDTLITTTNSGAVYRMLDTPQLNAEFRSAVKDVDRFSYFGHYRIEGDNLNHVAIAFRSGNTRTPDATWSAWSKPINAADGKVDVPAGRYAQWKLNMINPSREVVVDNVTVAYENRNVAPVIDAVTVQDPAVVYITGSYPPSPQVVEATNPDEYGIFTSLDAPRSSEQPGKRVFRKGFRTITWRAHDDNGDPLRYSLYFRRQGTDKWLRLRENVDETSMNFDTSQLPDGRYELRLIASDIIDNPDSPLTAEREGVDFQVDNTPPAITFTTQGDDVIVRVSDKLSPIGKVEYSADAQKWIRIEPEDGIADSNDETYRLKRSAIAGKFIIVRAVDAFYNVATESINVQ
ncbi:MAG TPA: hypothetical protein VKU62_01570 [Thermoanaerobaculia bacterium]|nr:hypothetical protein [Thermoanaerobaculia bacterium]